MRSTEKCGFDDERDPRPAAAGRRDEGFSKDEGLDVDIIKTRARGNATSDTGPPAEHIRAHHGGALRPRPVRQFRMCEWA